MGGKVQMILTSDVLRAHSYLGARGWELDDANGALVLYEYPKKGGAA